MFNSLHSNIDTKLYYQYCIRDAALRLGVPVYHLFEALSHEEQLRIAYEVIQQLGILQSIKSVCEYTTYISKPLPTQIHRINQYQYYIHEVALHAGIIIIDDFEDLSHEEQLCVACKIIQVSDDWNMASDIREQYNCVKDHLEDTLSNFNRLTESLNQLLQRLKLSSSTSLVNLENPLIVRE